MSLQSGRILVNSTDIATTPTLDLARSLRVRELVGFGRWPHHQGRPTAIWSRRR
jgi:iron complex transport system ATP-binding protein